MLGINALKLIINTFKNINTVMYVFDSMFHVMMAPVLSGLFLKLHLFFVSGDADILTFGGRKGTQLKSEFSRTQQAQKNLVTITVSILR